jgi:hypothetical protein
MDWIAVLEENFYVRHRSSSSIGAKSAYAYAASCVRVNLQRVGTLASGSVVSHVLLIPVVHIKVRMLLQAAFRLVVQPVVCSWRPHIIIVAAGFDAADGDPIGGCKVTPQVGVRREGRGVCKLGGREV